MSLALHLRILCEPDARYVGELSFFKKKRAWDKVKMILFAPGSHSGHFFMLLVWSLCCLVLIPLISKRGDFMVHLSLLFSLYMGLTFPFYLGERFTFKISNFLIRGLLWMGILLLPIVFYGVGKALDQVWHDDFGTFCQCIPVSSFFYTLSRGSSSDISKSGLLFVTHALLLIPVVITSIRYLKITYNLLDKIKPGKQHVQQG
jgi:hypothetical protein